MAYVWSADVSHPQVVRVRKLLREQGYSNVHVGTVDDFQVDGCWKSLGSKPR